MLYLAKTRRIRVNEFVGREEQVKILSKIYTSKEAELVALYGRRRIGKTYLIQQFFKDKGHYFELTGSHRGKTAEQLSNFSRAFSRYFLQGKPLSSNPKNWTEALALLDDAIEKIASEEKMVLFFDELPWLDSPKSGFLPALEHFWNAYMSKRHNVIVIVCGSAASWMIDKVIKNRGGLHGRISKKIHLLPFSLSEAESFLHSRGIQLDRKQFVELYMVTGGVAQYLKQVEVGKSAAQTINDLCFQPSGYLFNEFDDLYASLFNNYERHIKVIKALAKNRGGLSKEELLKKAQLSSGGVSSKIIEELLLSGFIAYTPFWGKKKSGGRYRLIDEFSLFYLRWMVEAGPVSDSQYWLKKQSSQSWSSWAGYSFESICLKHIEKIKDALGISSVSTTETTWSYTPAKGSDERGAQIDLIIDRGDRCIHLCEIKFYNREFSISPDYAENLRRKREIFQQQTETRKVLFTTLLTTYGVKRDQQYHSSVQNELTIDNLF